MKQADVEALYNKVTRGEADSMLILGHSLKLLSNETRTADGKPIYRDDWYIVTARTILRAYDY